MNFGQFEREHFDGDLWALWQPTPTPQLPPWQNPRLLWRWVGRRQPTPAADAAKATVDSRLAK